MPTNSTFRADAVNNHIVGWLRDYAANAKVKGFVVGISGGIDSAVTSALCAQTGYPTLCITMPIHQAASHVSRAREHIGSLMDRFDNVSEAEADLTSTFDHFAKHVPVIDNETLQNLTLANTRARLRMMTLYYFAGINSSLVVGTGNKVEDFGVGFFTKYGDGGVDISPIADLTKSQVRELGKYQGIVESIIVAKPTDGLFGDDRSDEDQLGASYDELEWAMEQKENGASPNDFTARQREVYEIFNRLNTVNQHKMRPIPICEIPLNLT